MSKTYILQKDLPFAKAGAIYTQENAAREYYNTDGNYYYNRLYKEVVEQNPEWFLPEENKSNDSFQWDDGKVWEFSVWNRESENQCGSLSASIRKFVDLHTPKPQAENKPDLDWEILEGGFHESNRHEWITDTSKGGSPCAEVGCKIFSVRRKSDGEVFSVGDEVETGNDAVVRDWSGKITEFWICGSYSESMHVFYNGNHCDLKYLKKKLPPQPQKQEQVEEYPHLYCQGVKYLSPKEVDAMCEDAFNAARLWYDNTPLAFTKGLGYKFQNFRSFKDSKR